jgi:hypothetical protein
VFGAVLPFAVVLGLLVLGWLRWVRPRRRAVAVASAPEQPGARD